MSDKLPLRCGLMRQIVLCDALTAIVVMAISYFAFGDLGLVLLVVAFSIYVVFLLALQFFLTTSLSDKDLE